MNFTKEYFDFQRIRIIKPPKDPIQEDMSILPGDQYIFPSISQVARLHKLNKHRFGEQYHKPDFIGGVHRVRKGIVVRMNFPIKVFVETLHNEYEWDTRKIIQKDYFCIETMMNFLAEKTITIQEDGAPFTYYTNAGL
jgi:hypothetical protein